MDPARILLVDDEAELVSALQERLEMRGFAVDGATDGETALSRLESATYDAVLLDMKMPALGGLKLLRRIKERWPALAVVLFTGYGSAQAAKDALQLGAFDCLMKPVSIEALVDVLRAAAGKESQSSE